MHAGTTLLSNNDVLSVYPSAGNATMKTEEYLYFTQTDLSAVVNTPFTLTLIGLNKEDEKNTEAHAEEGYTVILKNVDTEDTLTAVSDEKGLLTYTASMTGIYKVEAVSKEGITAVAAPYIEVTVKEPEPTAPPKPTVTPKPAAKPVLLVQLKSQKNSMILTWNKIKGADTYKIYGAKCGKDFKLLKTISAKKLTWTNGKLKKGTHYKYYVVALSKGKKLATSPQSHSVTKGSRYGYAQKITIKTGDFKLKVGKTKGIKASVTNSSKYMKNHVAPIRYLSSDSSVATVSQNGVVKAKKKGNCTIYCYTLNGLYKKVKVTVTK